MVKKVTIPFEASARLQQLIGRGLIPNEEMAIVELVKNAYDSGASKVRIVIRPDTVKEPGIIRIADDGSGMSESDIERLFMFAGYSERPEQAASARRTPTGEKGIGRFATDKLGRTLNVFTSKKAGTGIHLFIDWRKFEVKGRKKFSDIDATYEIRDVSDVVHEKSGTVLEIGHLSSRWDDAKIESLKVWLSDLINPFSKPTDFSIELDVAGSRRGQFVVDPVPPSGDVSMEIAVSNNKVRRVFREQGKKAQVVDQSAGSAADIATLNGLRARFIHFDKKPKRAAVHGLAPGVRIYRDGFRIEPFGSRTSDWLGVAEQRAKRAGHAHVVPNRLFGFVEISRKRNPELGDTTSRQALLDTEAARNLVTLLREGVSSLGEVIKERTLPRWKENRLKKSAELEQARLYTLGEVASSLAHELRQPLQSIRTEADNILAKLKRIGIQDGDIVEAQGAIDRGVVRIDKSISLVSNLSTGNITDVAECDLVKLLQEEVDVFANLCAARGIRVSLRAPKSHPALINEVAVSTIVANFLRNAMQSIEASTGTSIIVTLGRRGRNHRIEIADDGAGVPEEVLPRLFTKFATKKTGGMGFGLYYSKILVESLRGNIGHKPKKPGALFWMEIPEG